MSENSEVLISEQALVVPFNYSAGPVASRFFVALRDEQKIYGLKCAKCGQVQVPPRATCGACFIKMDEWVEVGPDGNLDNFTVVHYQESTHPAAAPFAVGIIRLDGADTGLVHLVALSEDGELKVGMRVSPVWARERRGHILDLECFAPAVS